MLTTLPAHDSGTAAQYQCHNCLSLIHHVPTVFNMFVCFFLFLFSHSVFHHAKTMCQMKRKVGDKQLFYHENRTPSLNKEKNLLAYRIRNFMRALNHFRLAVIFYFQLAPKSLHMTLSYYLGTTHKFKKKKKKGRWDPGKIVK